MWPCIPEAKKRLWIWILDSKQTFLCSVYSCAVGPLLQYIAYDAIKLNKAHKRGKADEDNKKRRRKKVESNGINGDKKQQQQQQHNSNKYE